MNSVWLVKGWPTKQRCPHTDDYDNSKVQPSTSGSSKVAKAIFTVLSVDFRGPEKAPNYANFSTEAT